MVAPPDNKGAFRTRRSTKLNLGLSKNQVVVMRVRERLGTPTRLRSMFQVTGAIGKATWGSRGLLAGTRAHSMVTSVRLSDGCAEKALEHRDSRRETGLPGSSMVGMMRFAATTGEQT